MAGSQEPLRLGVLVSGRGTNLQALIDATGSGDLPAEVRAVISDRADAAGLERARQAGIPAYFVDPAGFRERGDFDARLVSLLREHEVDLVVLAGFLRILGRGFVDAFPLRVINLHPSLLPAFPGLHAQRQALEHGVKVSGCTVHFIDYGLDSGPIILQAAVPVREDDTEETLTARILEQEHRILREAVKLIAAGVEIRGRHVFVGQRERRRALLSVSDKTGIADFARGLGELGYEIVSTGGTARFLAEAGIAVTPVSRVTGFPEILDGRVKTLHPAVHGGILARRDLPEHREQIERLGIVPIDVVAVNLYPFRATISRPGVTLSDAVEQIDIGGPCLLRAAAKNHAGVIVIVNPDRYGEVLAELRAGRDPGPRMRLELAIEAYRHTAFYDAVIAENLGATGGLEAPGGLAGAGDGDFPRELTLAFELALPLRYGENPHQPAAFYRDPLSMPGSLANAEKLQGKELSFNNINDAEAAWALAQEFEEPVAVAVKHANPCGVAVAATPAEAFRRAHEADPVSIFGGIAAFNGPVDAAAAAVLSGIFLEVVIAPEFTPEALGILARKGNLRVLRTGGLPDHSPQGRAGPADGLDGGPAGGLGDRRWLDLRRVSGGLLVQAADLPGAGAAEWRCVTSAQPSGPDLRELLFVWRVVKHVKSNAIVIGRAGQTIGVGAGQMNRIDAARIAIRQAGERARGAYLASDAFFPFPDVVEEAAVAGIRAIVQPGGSVRDEESIRAADGAGLVMLFTGRRHFRH